MIDLKKWTYSIPDSAEDINLILSKDLKVPPPFDIVEKQLKDLIIYSAAPPRLIITVGSRGSGKSLLASILKCWLSMTEAFEIIEWHPKHSQTYMFAEEIAKKLSSVSSDKQKVVFVEDVHESLSYLDLKKVEEQTHELLNMLWREDIRSLVLNLQTQAIDHVLQILLKYPRLSYFLGEGTAFDIISKMFGQGFYSARRARMYYLDYLWYQYLKSWRESLGTLLVRAMAFYLKYVSEISRQFNLVSHDYNTLVEALKQQLSPLVETFDTFVPKFIKLIDDGLLDDTIVMKRNISIFGVSTEIVITNFNGQKVVNIINYITRKFRELQISAIDQTIVESMLSEIAQMFRDTFLFKYLSMSYEYESKGIRMTEREALLNFFEILQCIHEYYGPFGNLKSIIMNEKRIQGNKRRIIDVVLYDTNDFQYLIDVAPRSYERVRDLASSEKICLLYFSGSKEYSTMLRKLMQEDRTIALNVKLVTIPLELKSVIMHFASIIDKMKTQYKDRSKYCEVLCYELSKDPANLTLLSTVLKYIMQKCS